MLDFELRRKLRRLFGGPVPVRPEHARELEGELMARFGELYPEQEVRPMKRFWLKKAAVLAAAAMIGGGAACVAPADLEVAVGQRVTIRAAEDVAMPDPEAIARVVRGEGQQQVQMRMRREPGAATLQLEVWSDEPSQGGVAETIRKAFPELAKAEIQEEKLEGTVRGTLGKKLGRELLDLDLIDRGDVEAARRQVMEQLAAQGVEGKVDVTIEDEGGERKVKIRVEREECPPGEEPAPPSP